MSEKRKRIGFQQSPDDEARENDAAQARATNEGFELFYLNKEYKARPLLLGIYDYLNSIGYRAKVDKKTWSLYKVGAHWFEPAYEPQLHASIIDYFTNPDTRPEDIGYTKSKITHYVTARDILENITSFGLDKIIKTDKYKHLKEADFKELRHTKDKAYFYFKNGFVEVTKDSIKLKPYTQLQGGKVSRARLVNKDIELYTDRLNEYGETIARRGRNFTDFLACTCLVPAKAGDTVQYSENGIDYTVGMEKYTYLCQLIGYLLHDYKRIGVTDFCVIFCDDEAGGSGKGLIVQAIKKMFADKTISETVVEVDCKTDDMKFSKEELGENTRLKVYSDIDRDFSFKMVYNELTESANVRKMHRQPFSIPFEESWKIIITSNHIVKGQKGSDLRRKRVFDLFPFFSDKRQVHETYGHSFFTDDWSETDWNYFYSFMFNCVQMWLALDYDKTFGGFRDVAYQKRQITESYIPEFIEYMDSLPRNVWLKTGELYKNFLEQNQISEGRYKNKLIGRSIAGNPTVFGRMLTGYLKDTDTDFVKTANRMEIRILEKDKADAPQLSFDDDLPF